MPGDTIPRNDYRQERKPGGWRKNLSEEQARDLPPRSGETLKHYAMRWRRHCDEQSQADFQRRWEESRRT